jgi:diaminopimelate epimerase
VVALTGAKSLETGGGLVEGGTFGAEVEVSLPPPHFAWNEVPLNYPMDTAHLPLAWGPLEHPMALSVGNPHLVFFVADETRIDLVSIGPSIEHDPAFPERINVNIASARDDGIHTSQGEARPDAMACGTGACATGVAAIVQKKRIAVRVPCGGTVVGWAPESPSACADRPRTSSRARSTWSNSADGRPDDHPRLPAELRRERGDACAGRR